MRKNLIGLLLLLGLAGVLVADQTTVNGSRTLLGFADFGAATATRLATVNGTPASSQCNTSKTVTGATNASPIVITATSHGFSNGDVVTVYAVGGNTAANGSWVVQNVATNTFELAGSTGNGSYTSGGFASAQVGKLAFQNDATAGENLWECTDPSQNGTLAWTRQFNRSTTATVSNKTLDNTNSFSGYVDFTAIAAPGTPASGKARVYVDSTSKLLCSKDDAGVATCGGSASPGGSNGDVQIKNGASLAAATGFNYSGSTMAVSDGKLLDLSAVNNSATTEGIKLPQGTSMLSGLAEGQMGWDTANDTLYIGDAVAAVRAGGSRWRMVEEYYDCQGDSVDIRYTGATGSGNGPVTNNTSDAQNALGVCKMASTAAAAGSSVFYLILPNTTNALTQQVITGTNMREFVARVATEATTTENFLVGGVRIGTSGDLNTKTDGIYFWCGKTSDTNNDGTVDSPNPDVDGDGNVNGAASCATDADDCAWWAVADKGVATDNVAMAGASKPSGRTATVSTVSCNTANTTWNLMRITYDGTTAHWYINGTEIGTGVATANLPAAQTLSMWGFATRNTASVVSNGYMDYIYYTGIR